MFKRSKNKYRKKKIFPDISHLQNFPIPSKFRCIVPSTKKKFPHEISSRKTCNKKKKEIQIHKKKTKKKQKELYRFESKQIDKKETF